MANKKAGAGNGKAKLAVKSLTKHADGDAAKVKGGSTVVTDLRARAAGDGSVLRADVLSTGYRAVYRG